MEWGGALLWFGLGVVVPGGVLRLLLVLFGPFGPLCPCGGVFVVGSGRRAQAGQPTDQGGVVGCCWGKFAKAGDTQALQWQHKQKSLKAIERDPAMEGNDASDVGLQHGKCTRRPHSPSQTAGHGRHLQLFKDGGTAISIVRVRTVCAQQGPPRRALAPARFRNTGWKGKGKSDGLGVCVFSQGPMEWDWIGQYSVKIALFVASLGLHLLPYGLCCTAGSGTASTGSLRTLGAHLGPK